jgi:hypothetical protein
MKAASKLATLVSGAASAHEQKSRRKAFPGPSKAEIKHVRQIQEPPADPDILHHREAELVPTETDQTTAPGKKLSKRDRQRIARQTLAAKKHLAISQTNLPDQELATFSAIWMSLGCATNLDVLSHTWLWSATWA